MKFMIRKKELMGRLIHFAAILSALLVILMTWGCGAGGSGSFTDNSGERQAVLSDTADAKGASARYTRKDIAQLRDTGNFSKGALEHIFDGTINKKGKATGYHYSMLEGSRGHIINGTRSRPDERGVFTAKVEVDDVRKDGFSSFYPETWSPQEVVDAINTAYEDAMADPENPHGSLWVGHCGDLEIDMYLDSRKKIITAYPIFVGKKS